MQDDEDTKQDQEEPQGLLLQAERAVSESRELAEDAQKGQRDAESEASAAEADLDVAKQELLQAQEQLQQMHGKPDSEGLVAAKQQAAEATAELQRLLHKRSTMHAESQALADMQHQLRLASKEADEEKDKTDALHHEVIKIQQQIQSRQTANQQDLEKQASELTTRLQQQDAGHDQELADLQIRLSSLQASRCSLQPLEMAPSAAPAEEELQGQNH